MEVEPKVRAFFLASLQRACFCVGHGFDSLPVKCAIVYAPPFAEEANKTRRMAALQARAWAEIGVGTVLVDPFGTGDSQGEFGDARWGFWVQDLAHAVEWVRARGVDRVWLWGLRSGTLLATEALQVVPPPVAGLILWQPVTVGSLFLRQFLRLRMAADLAGPRRETVKDMLGRLEGGEALEVAGYDLHPALAQALGGKDLAGLAPPKGTRVRWFEVGSAEGGELGTASMKVVEAWRGRGLDVEVAVVEGPPFWASQEIVDCPALIEATKNLVLG